MPDEFTDGESRGIEIKRPGRMVLHPLAEVRIGVLVTIVVGSSQLVVNILRHSERGKHKENTDHPQCHSSTEQTEEARGLYRQGHHDVRMRARVCLCKAALRSRKVKLIGMTLSTAMDFPTAIR